MTAILVHAAWSARKRYGGAVIKAAGADQEKVKALLYIAAMAPDQEETVAQLLHRAEPHPEGFANRTNDRSRLETQTVLVSVGTERSHHRPRHPDLHGRTRRCPH
jgi:hypothetical protein